MTLRAKALLITGIAFITAFLALYLVLRVIVLGGFLKAENSDVESGAKHILEVFDQNAIEFSDRFADWSSWEDAYQFVLDGNQAFIDSNLNDETVKSMKLNLIVFVGLDGKIVFSSGFDPLGNKESLDEALIKKHFSNGSLLMRTEIEQKNLAGILLLPSGPMVISSRPIFNSKNEGLVHGTLVTGRYLVENQVKKLSRLTGRALSIYRLDEVLLPQDIEWARFSLAGKHPILVRPVSEEAIAAYTYLEDVYGERCLVLKVEQSRDIYLKGKTSLFSFLISMFFIGLIFIALVIGLLERAVLSRLFVLNSGVNKIRKSGKLSDRVPVEGKDELSHLAESINSVLQTVELSNKEQLKSEERFNLAVRGSSDGIWDWNLQTDEIYYSPRYKKLLGYEDEEFKNTPSSFETHLHPEDNARVFEALKEHLEMRVPYDTEYRLRHKNGQYLWFRARGQAVWDPKTREALRVAGSLTDITERRRSEMIIRENERRMRTLLENVGLVAVGLNVEGRIEYANPHFLKLTGYTTEEVLEKNWFSFFIPETDRDQARMGFKEFLIRESVSHNQLSIRTKTGEERLIKWNHTLLRSDMGKTVGTLSLGSDITEESRMQEQMVEAGKMATVAQLAAGAAHEVKNPLAILLQAVEHLSKNIKDIHPDTRDLLGSMDEAIHRADNIIKGLLDLSKPTQLDIKPEDLNPIIDQTLSLFKNHFDRKKIQIVRELDPLIPRVNLDKNKIIQVLINIFSNAVEAMPEGSVLSVKSDIESVRNLVVAGGGRKNEPVKIVKQFVTVEIADSGEGIPEHVLPNIFEPFFTTKRGKGGTGLGLPIVKNIMKIHDGMVNVYNRKEGGALVTLSFPVY